METIIEIIKEAYLKGGNDAQGNGLWKISAEETAIKYAQEQVKNLNIPSVRYCVPKALGNEKEIIDSRR